MAEKKLYDFKVESVKSKIVAALKKRRLESTVTDLVASTGLPTYQVQETMKVVSHEYRGHMKVTESGEILYYFPSGMRSQTKGLAPALRRFLRSAGSALLRVLSLLFKIWIMVMLVGYFLVFVALLVIAVLASVAGSFSSNSSDNRSRGRDGGFGGFMGFYLTTRVIELFIQIWLYSGLVKGERRQRRPLHRSVFSYVFGEGNPNKGFDAVEKKAVIHYLQGNKGLITIEEFMAITGLGADAAEERINTYLLEFEGEPDVTSDGTLHYRFPGLLKSRDLPLSQVPRTAPRLSLHAFSGNKPSANRWITFFNIVNLFFGGYFLYYSTVVVIPQKGDGFAYLYQVTSVLLAHFVGVDPLAVIPIALGAVPLVFSALFFLIPLVRRAREKARNESVKKRNFLQRLFDRILQNPLLVDPRKIQPADYDETPSRWESFRDRSIKELAARKAADVKQIDGGAFVYEFGELDREQRDIAKVRNSIDLSSFNLGKTVFDSGE